MKNLWYTLDLQLFGGEVADGAVGETGEKDDAVAGQNGADTVDLESEFSQLINGKFKEQFTKKTQAIIDKRFKETKILEDYRNRVSPTIQRLMEKYGIEEGEEGKLAELLNENTAEKRGTENETDIDSEDSADDYKEKRRFRLKERVSSWVKESQSLKELYPDFDLRKELQNSQLFSQLVMGGAPVKAAFETVHRDEILSGAMAYTADKVREQVVKNIETKGRRPLENGISSESAVVTSVDVNSLTSKDILKILKQVENGANIKF